MDSNSMSHRLLWSLLLLVAFLVSGCFVFITLERGAELERYEENRKLYEQMRELYTFEHCEDPAFAHLSFCKGQADFSKSLEAYFNEHGNSIVDQGQWTVVGTVFFLTHLATTIGYGGSHAKTAGGQLATIFFALAGIPIMGYTLAQVARLNLKFGVILLRRICSVEVRTVKGQIGVLWGLLSFILFGGAAVYTWLEPWTYSQSLYFCFVTLSTVGFGDFLPSSALSKGFSIFYMISGLGVCASIIALMTGFIADSHGTVDSFLSRKLEDTRCQQDCCGLRDRQDATAS